MRVLTIVVFVALCLGANCAGCPVTPTPLPDSGTTPGDAPSSATCQAMCANLLDKKCEEAVKKGVDKCVETCTQIVSSGSVNLDINCVASATTTSEVQKCGVRCK